MAVTTNGATVIATPAGTAYYGSPDLVKNPIPGTGGLVYEGGLLRGDVDVVLRYVGAYWHRFIEPVVKHWDATQQKWVPQCWGYAYRPKRGQSSGFSEHAAGCATDTNSARHPQYRRTLSVDQRAKLAELKLLLSGVVGFGAFWSESSLDEMHAEIVKFGEELRRVADRIRNGQMPTNFPELVTAAAPSLSTVVQPPAPAPAVGSDWLRRGFTGDRVRLLQQRLIAWGITVGVDGDFGPATEGAVRVFQTRHRLPATGIVDPQTWAALHTSPAPPYPGALVREGSTGPAVRAIQQRLGVAADGQFGPRTKAAVVAFQRSKGLGADGIVGPATWKALFA
jgi:Putative peptidoglycan binding domain